MSNTQFLLHKMFQEGYKVTFSDEEIARCWGISAERVREYIEQDVEAGMFFKKPRYLYLLSHIFRSGCFAKKGPAFWASLLRTNPKIYLSSSSRISTSASSISGSLSFGASCCCAPSGGGGAPPSAPGWAAPCF